LRRNSISKQEFLPLKTKLISQTDFISAADRRTIETVGNGMIISLLIAVGVNVAVGLFSSGSMELMWSFINVV
jgi:hypothetical protein